MRDKYHILRCSATLLAAATFFLLCSCARKPLPYENGPVMREKHIKQTFDPILKFIDYKPGMSFADIGAGSGAITVMMASLMEGSSVYIQDIDATVLNNENVEKIIDYYSRQSGRNLKVVNQFHLVLGTFYRTNLPDSAFDLIYSNGTVHVFSSLDSIAVDLKRKLKPGGVLCFRDSFKSDHGEKEFCSDPKCGGKLLTIDECISTMERNGFKLVKEPQAMSGYPVLAFSAGE